MHRILILDADTPARARLVQAIERAAGAEVVLADTVEDLVAKVKFGLFAAAFADADLLGERAPHAIAAVRTAIARPMFIVASNEKLEALDPDLVTLIVKKPYDVATVTGVLLSAVPTPLPEPDAKPDSASAR